MSVGAIWTFALLWPDAGPLRAASPPAGYVIANVTVLGGNPIQGVRDGVIFQRLGCSPEAEPPEPVAGSLGAAARLDVEFRSCPGEAPPPTGQCELQVGGEARVIVAVSGWQVTLPVELPSATGIYALSLRCALSGQPELGLATDLFVTLAKPVFPALVPWRDWYRLACSWGAGLKASDPPATALEKILHGLHDHGQRLWRYGYCTKVDNLCVFGETALPFNSRDLTRSGDLGACKWWLLASGNPRCNFTDCFGYSALFRNIAASLGLGVRALPPVRGSKGKGFSVNGWLKALDPAAGNLDCGYRRLGCAYLFGVHSLVISDGLLYDATLGQIYRGVGGLIAQNILSKGDGEVILEKSRACLLDRPPYGGFPNFLEIDLPPRIEGCPIDRNHPAVFLRGLGGDLETNAVELESVEGDAKPEVVKVRLTVRVDVAGNYQVYGALYAGLEGRVPVADRPGLRAQIPYSTARISGLPGLYRVTLTFSGESVVRSPVPPPFWIDATIVADHGISDTVRLQLPRFSLAGLGEQEARLEGFAATEQQRLPGQGKVLRLSVPVAVRTAGSYAASAYLLSAGHTVAETATYVQLSPGRETLVLNLPAEAIALQGLEGPFTVTVELDALDPATGAVLSDVDTLSQDLPRSILPTTPPAHN